MRRRLVLAALALPGLARAQAPWPDRPVRIIVPFTPGGSTDILARSIAQPLGEALGQPFVVENRAGAGGTVGCEVVARAVPDGTTLLMGHIGTLAVNPALYKGLSFDTVTSFAPIIEVASVPSVLIANPRKLPVTGVAALIAAAKAKPGALTYGSGGNGSAAHISMVAFCEAAGVEMTHIPYRGTSPMMNDLIAGQIDLTMTGGPPALPPVRAGQVKALGVSSLKRLATAPEIPTIAEQGLAGFDAVQWYGLLAPAGTPRPIIDRLNAECAKALRSPALAPRLEAEGAEPNPGTPEAFGALIVAERVRWGALVARAKVTPD